MNITKQHKKLRKILEKLLEDHEAVDSPHICRGAMDDDCKGTPCHKCICSKLHRARQHAQALLDVFKET